MINKKQQKVIIDILKPFNPDKIGVFGSYARGENQINSDLDILASFPNSPNLLELVQIENELSEKLNIKTDLVTERSIKENLMPYISEDLQLIYE